MHKILEMLEHFIDRAIPYALVVLLVLIILEFTFDLTPYETYVTILDESIVVLFVIDLCFKYHRVKTTVQFFKTYWLEILAVFPFYLIIRTYAALFELSKGVEETQKVLHEATLIRETRALEELRVARELRLVEEEARLAREGNLVFRVMRGIQRAVRILYGRLRLVQKLLFHVRPKKRKK